MHKIFNTNLQQSSDSFTLKYEEKSRLIGCLVGDNSVGGLLLGHPLVLSHEAVQRRSVSLRVER